MRNLWKNQILHYRTGITKFLLMKKKSVGIFHTEPHCDLASLDLQTCQGPNRHFYCCLQWAFCQKHSCLSFKSCPSFHRKRTEKRYQPLFHFISRAWLMPSVKSVCLFQCCTSENQSRCLASGPRAPTSWAHFYKTLTIVT